MVFYSLIFIEFIFVVLIYPVNVRKKRFNYSVVNVLHLAFDCYQSDSTIKQNTGCVSSLCNPKFSLSTHPALRVDDVVNVAIATNRILLNINMNTHIFHFFTKHLNTTQCKISMDVD